MTAEQIPLDVLFGNPERVSPQLSPDGGTLSWLAPHEGVMNVWVNPVGAGDDQARVVTEEAERPIRSYGWAHDGRHLLYIQDSGGDEDWHLYATDVVEGGTRDLTPFEKISAQILHGDQHHPDVILVGINKDNEQLHDVYECRLATGELTKVAENPGFVGWIADTELAVRGAVAPTPEGGVVVLVRDTVDDEWRPLLTAPQEDGLTTGPIGFDQAGKRLLCQSSLEANTSRLVWIDLATGEVEVVAADDRYDVSDVSIDPQSKAPRGVAFERDRLVWAALDDSVAEDFARIGAHDPGDWHLIDRDHSDRTWLVGYDHDDGPVSYYAYDRDSGAFTFLFVHQPELAELPLVPMEPFSFEARDGLLIEGYVTYPAEHAGSTPAILNVHGGPWARDAWGLDPHAQWMANRGYACVQVNFRGSTGYGKAHINAGDKQWGRAMHTDLLDAIAYLSEPNSTSGTIDATRVAIFGGSYGGYAALVGAAFTPEHFACAVDIVGPSNLQTLIKSIPPYWAPMIAQFHTRMGHPDTDADDLWEMSPLSKADNISIPLLIAQGANDPRVKQAESEQIVAAMDKAGIPHQYELYEDEGHGFARPENRLDFYAKAEKFLAEHV